MMNWTMNWTMNWKSAWDWPPERLGGSGASAFEKAKKFRVKKDPQKR
jgi:hypothetical protein